MTDAHDSWRSVSKKRRAEFKALLPLPCGFCGRAIGPNDPFDLDHISGVQSGDHSRGNLRVAHPRCNRADGGRKGRARQSRASRDTRRLPDW
ncbi:HNH endonuclease [Curtobacterium poinsettiae]|uniref:HNH endonuclease n=1 Tax=Curtobacterium TaxID=2034 RepID=UPI0034D9581F